MNHFTVAELACKHCGQHKIPLDFVEKLEALREQCGFPLPITSGYRCPEYNAKVSSTGLTGPHTKARAVDIAVRGEQAMRLVALAIVAGFTGIGLNQKGGARFVHLDDLPNAPGQPRPTCWSY